MATACLLEWTGVCTNQIEPLIDLLDLEKKLQVGSAVFAAGEDGGKLIVITVWDSCAALDQFVESCLSQAVARAGLKAPFIKHWEVNDQAGSGNQWPRLEWNSPLKLDYHTEAHEN